MKIKNQTELDRIRYRIDCDVSPHTHTHSLFPLNASIVASFCRARMNYTNQSLYACFLFRFDYTIYFTVCHVSINFFHANERVALRHIFFYFVARTKFLVSTIVCIICHQSCFFSVWLMIIQSNKKNTPQCR